MALPTSRSSAGALAFYRALGGVASGVTLFDFKAMES
jgi:hypothetical protein